MTALALREWLCWRGCDILINFHAYYLKILIQRIISQIDAEIRFNMNYNFKNNVEYKFILKSKSTFNTCYKHCNTLIFVTVKAINYEVVIKFRLSRSLTEQHNSKCVIWISPKLRKIYQTLQFPWFFTPTFNANLVTSYLQRTIQLSHQYLVWKDSSTERNCQSWIKNIMISSTIGLL